MKYCFSPTLPESQSSFICRLSMAINNTEIKQAIEAYRPDMDITEKAQKRKTDFTISKKTDAVLKKLAKNHEISLQNLLHILLFYAVQEVRALAIQRCPGIESARNHSET